MLRVLKFSGLVIIKLTSLAAYLVGAACVVGGAGVLMGAI